MRMITIAAPNDLCAEGLVDALKRRWACTVEPSGGVHALVRVKLPQPHFHELVQVVEQWARAYAIDAVELTLNGRGYELRTSN
jgi:hypothetical protein